MRHSESEGAFETTYIAILVAGYLSNLRDPVLGVWLEMSGVRILPGRYDQDAGVGDSGSIKLSCDWKGEAVLVIDRKIMFILVSIYDYVRLSIRTRINGGGRIVFHLEQI